MGGQTLTLKLTADGSGLTATLQSASGSVQKFSSNVKNAENQTRDSAGKIEGAFGGIKSALGDIATAVGIAFSVDKINGMVRSAIDGASRIQNLSQTLGIGTQTLQAMSYAAGLTDTSLDSLVGSLSRLERASLEARDGNVQSAAAFAAVGISVDQIRKLSPDQLFEATAKGISRLQDGSTKTALAMQLMGRGAAENIPFINKMGNELEGLKDKAAQVGIVLSNIDQAALAAFSDKTNELGQDVKGLSNQLAIALLPALTSVVGQLQRAAENGNLQAFFKDVGDAAQFLADHIDAITTAAKTLTEIKIASWAADGISGLKGLATAADGAATSILSIKGMLGLVGAAIAGWNIGSWLQQNFAVAQVAGTAFIGAMLKGWETVKTGALIAWVEIKQGFANFVADAEVSAAALIGVFSKIAAAQGNFAGAQALDVVAQKLQSTAASARDFSGEFAKIGGDYRKNIADINDWMQAENDATASDFKRRDALKAAAAGAGDFTNILGAFDANFAKAAAGTKGFQTNVALLNGALVAINAEADKQIKQGADEATVHKNTAAAILSLVGAFDSAKRSAGSYRTNIDATTQRLEQLKQAQLQEAAAIAQLQGALDPIAKIYGDYAQGVIQATAAYQKQIALGGAAAGAYDELKQHLKALMQVRQAEIAQMEKEADVIGQISKKMSEDSALVGLRDRARAQKQAVQDAVNAWLKLPDAVRIAQVEQGKFNADLVNNLGEQAGALQGLQQAMTDFSGVSPFEKFTQDLKSLQDELKKVGNATSDAFDPARAKQLEIVIGDIRQQMLVYATQSIGQSIGALQSLAGEGTKAYKELAVAQDALNLVTAIGAIVNQGLGDPYTAFARIAAMAAIMAKLVGDIGSVGGSSGPSPESAAVRQQTQGTGTVLGDAKAQSDSIAKAMDITAKATTALVGINRGMLNALQSLQAALGAAGTQLAQGAGNATFPGLSSGNAFNNALSSLDPLGGDPITKALGNFLFGGSKKVIDQGIVIAGGTLQNMLDNIVVGAYQTVHKSGGLFSSGKTYDQLSSVSSDFSKQFELVIQSISDAVKQGATALGILPADIQAAMDKFKIAETHISLQGLSAADQQKAIEAVFSQIFDSLAGAVVPFIGQFQKVGEGLGETLVRVATEVQVTQEAVKQLGFAVNTTDPEKFAQIADGLTTAMGGVDNFITGMQAFTDKFSSDSDKFKYEQDSLTSAFSQMGLTLPTTREGMMDLMHSLDASTASGQKAIATLLSLTGIADQYYSDLEKQQQAADAAIAAQIQAQKDYNAEVRGIDLKIGKVSPIIDQLQQIRQWSIDEAAKLNALAKAAGMAGAAESDLAKVQVEAAQEAAAAIATLKQSAEDLAVKLGYTDNLDSLNAKIAALQSGAGNAAASIGNAASSISAAGDALNLEIGDLSPYSDQKKLDLALQGLRAGTVSADQVLQIGRRLYASGDDYNKLFEQVLGISNAQGGGTHGVAVGAGSGNQGNSKELADLIAQRDLLEKQARKEDAQNLAQKIADLAQAEHESVQDVAKDLGVNLGDLAKDLGVGNDKIGDYLVSLEKQDLAGTFVDASGNIVDAISSGSDAIVAAINGIDFAGRPAPGSTPFGSPSTILPGNFAGRPAPGSTTVPPITPAPIAPGTPPPSAGGGGGGGGGGNGGGITPIIPGDGSGVHPAVMAMLGQIVETNNQTNRLLADSARKQEAFAKRGSLA